VHAWVDLCEGDAGPDLREGRVRNVSESTRERVYRAYGIRHHRTGQYEVDHLVPLEAGGSNSVADLFPQPAHPRGGGLGFHDKDRLENVVHDRVCTGTSRLRPAQRRIARNWVGYFHDLGLLPARAPSWGGSRAFAYAIPFTGTPESP
jgi:hypothetical protein